MTNSIDGLITKDDVYRIISGYKKFIDEAVAQSICERVKITPCVTAVVPSIDYCPKCGKPEEMLAIIPITSEPYDTETYNNIITKVKMANIRLDIKCKCRGVGIVHENYLDTPDSMRLLEALHNRVVDMWNEGAAGTHRRQL